MKYAYELLEGTDVKVAAVVGFPLGAMSMEARLFEAKNAIAKRCFRELIW